MQPLSYRIIAGLKTSSAEELLEIAAVSLLRVVSNE
jgi:hypothetical protein